MGTAQNQLNDLSKVRGRVFWRQTTGRGGKTWGALRRRKARHRTYDVKSVKRRTVRKKRASIRVVGTEKA